MIQSMSKTLRRASFLMFVAAMVFSVSTCNLGKGASTNPDQATKALQTLSGSVGFLSVNSKSWTKPGGDPNVAFSGPCVTMSGTSQTISGASTFSLTITLSGYTEAATPSPLECFSLLLWQGANHLGIRSRRWRSVAGPVELFKQ
jgi:hypothetical protein